MCFYNLLKRHLFGVHELKMFIGLYILQTQLILQLKLKVQNGGKAKQIKDSNSYLPACFCFAKKVGLVPKVVILYSHH